MWFFSPRIFFGEESLENLETIQGRKALIVTGRSSIRLGYAERVKKTLEKADFEVSIYDRIESEPSIDSVKKAAHFAYETEPDWVVGLGGGSYMDAAKITWLLYSHPDLANSLDSVSPAEPLDLRENARLIAIPTTSGSGSEVTMAAVLTDTSNNRKIIIANRELVPDIAIVDPQFVANLPPEVTAHSGMDVLVHAVEAYTGQRKNHFTDACALMAAKTVFEYLQKTYKGAVSGNEESEAREKMHYAATLAGLAVGNSQTGLSHALGQALGSVLDIPHGKTVGILLPYVMAFNLLNPEPNDAKNQYYELESQAEIEKGTLISEVKDLLASVNISLTLKDLAIKEEIFRSNLDMMVSIAGEYPGAFLNSRTASDDDIRRLFQYSYEGKDIDF